MGGAIWAILQRNYTNEEVKVKPILKYFNLYSNEDIDKLIKINFKKGNQNLMA